MKTKVIILCAVMAILSACGVKKSQAYYDYKTKLIGTELDGTYTLRSWGRAPYAADAYVQAHKQAVYDVIFTGVDAASSNLTSLKPLLFEVNARDKYEDYFNKFFADGGIYTKYCSIKEKKIFSSVYSRTKPQVVCHTTVMVDRAKLRQRLIEDKILKIK